MDGIIDRLQIIRDDKSATASSRPHVVIIGAGFGGLFAAMQLARVAADVTVIDRRNHHLFQPLLYQVATAALSPADIAAPIRGILSRQANADVTLGTVTGIDTAGRAVLIGGRRIPYDQLVIATGARETNGQRSHPGSRVSRMRQRCGDGSLSHSNAPKTSLTKASG